MLAHARSLLTHGALLAAVLLPAAALLLTGCEDAFDPFEDVEVRFSMQGYLDVSADTQYVRVSELQQSAFANPEVNATVVLDDLDRGTAVTMRDSVFTYENGAQLHNFWTATPIRPSTTYRITSTAPDGVAASATFATPAAVPIPELESGLSEFSSPKNPPTAQSLTLFEVEKVADLQIRYELAEPTTVIQLSYADRLNRAPNGRLTLALNAYADVQQALTGTTGAICPSLNRAQILLAITTEAWPDFRLIDIEQLVLPATATNVEGGLGFVGGVLTLGTEWDALRSVFALNRAGCNG
ncbi:MAG: hypothetical protein AAGF99_16595 [Bacteroidota bacterium]